MIQNAICLFILGLIFGDFLNAFIGRLHDGKDWVKGRSKCDNCHKVLKPYDLIPVFSWLLLRGRCRYCHKQVSWTYPIIEVITGLLFLGSYLFWPYGFDWQGIMQFIVWLYVLVGFVAQAIYDLKWKELHSIITDSSIVLVLLTKIILIVVNKDTQLIFGSIFGILIGAGIFYILYKVSNEKWIGGGDVRLGLLFGLLVGGPLNASLVISIASLSGTLISLPLMIGGKLKAKSTIPFGPMLIFATIIVYLGQDVINHILKTLNIL